MLSMTDGQLTNVLLSVIGGLLVVMWNGIKGWMKKVDYKNEKQDRKLENHETRLVTLEANQGRK